MLSVFQSVLRAGSSQGSNLRRIFIQSPQFCSVGNDIIRHQPLQDELLNDVRRAKDTLEVLDLVGDHSLTSNQTIACLRAIFQHQKPEGRIIKSSDILRHPVFEHLCQNLKRNLRSLSLNDTIDSLKILLFLGIQPNSRIMTSLLSLIRLQINDVTLGHLVFLDYLLRKMEKTPLVEALSIALPMIFQIQLPLKMDRDNIRELNDCLTFAVKNHVSEQAKTSVVTALTLHGEDLTALEAAFTIRTMCDMKPYNPAYDKLIQNCFSVLNKNFYDLYFSTFDSILTKVVERYSFRDTAFYNEEFMTHCAEFVTKNNEDLQKAFSLLKKFNKISFVNIELLNYLMLKLARDPKILEDATPGYILTLVAALSTANYIPPEWTIIKEHVLRNPLFENKRVDLPWLKFILDLLVLDIWKPDLIERVFQPEFLRQYFARDNNQLDHSLLLMIYQVVKTLKKDEYTGPLPGDKYLIKAEELSVTEDQLLAPSLKYIYSNFSILSKARTRLGHTIEHVIVLDQGNHPAEPSLSSEEIIENASQTHTVEDLQEKGFKLLAIVRPKKAQYVHNFDRLKGIFMLKYKTLEEILPVAFVSGRIWKDLGEKEKIPYLEQVIKEALEKPRKD